MRKALFVVAIALPALLHPAAASGQGKSATSSTAEPTVKVGRAAQINGDYTRWTAPAEVLFAPGTPGRDGFRLYLDYKLEDNAKAWIYNNRVDVRVERESGAYGSQDWGLLWSDSRTRSKAFPWEVYKEVKQLTSGVVTQSDPVQRYRVFITATSNGDAQRLGGDKYHDKVIRHLAWVPRRGGKNLGATLASAMATRLVFEQGKAAFQAIGRASDRPAMRTAVRNLELNTLAFFPGVDWVLANTKEDYLNEAVEFLAGKVRYAGGYFSAVFLLTEYTQKAFAIATDTTADINRLIRDDCYCRIMGRVDRNGDIDGPDGRGSYKGFDLALAASDAAIGAIRAYGYGDQADWNVLDAALTAAAADLQTAAGHFDGARLTFDSEARGSMCNFSLAGADNLSAAIARAQKFFDQHQLTLAGQLMAIKALQAAGPPKTFSRPKVKPGKKAGWGQDFKLSIHALDDRPGPVVLRLQGFDANGKSTYDNKLSWTGDDNRYSTRAVILPGRTVRVRLTFLNDLWRRDAGPDGDRNAFIDFVATKERRYEAEDFSRTGGAGGDPGCHRSRPGDATLSGGGFANCGNGSDWIEIDLFP